MKLRGFSPIPTKKEIASFSIPHIVYALNEKIFGRATFEHFEDFKKVQWYSKEKLKEWQFEKFKKLLIHAADYVDYYRQYFDAVGFCPKSMSSLEDLQRIPFLTKDDVRPHPDRLIAKGKKRKLTRYATSGSTGSPLIFYKDDKRIASNKGAYLLFYDWWDITVGDREAVLWGNSNDISAYSILKRLRDQLMNTHLLSAFHMGEESMYRYLKFLRKYKPKNLFGYAHGIYLLARFAKNRNVNLREIGIKVIFVTAEVLHDFQRELIEEVFAAPVANSYGGRDSGLVAFECPYQRMHINPAIYVEIVAGSSPAKPGEKGEIVMTDLDAFGMPFIRYRTGDEAILDENQECKCGRQWTLLKQILGRDKDYLVSPKKEFIHPLALEYIFRELEGIDYFKIVQKREDELVINLLVNEYFNKTMEDDIKDKIFKVMDSTVKVHFNYIQKNEIPTENKYRFVVSEVIGKYLPQ